MKIIQPTLLLNVARAKRNIERITAKAQKSGVCFRPHFKTHQSAQVAEWFRDAGVRAITVSSVGMAEYFAAHGWTDITIAFPANILEIEKMNRLAKQVTLHLLVESLDTVEYLQAHLTSPVNVWIKIDTGYHRTGMLWDHYDEITAVAQAIGKSDRLTLQGLLTHSGHTYRARSAEEVHSLYTETVFRMNQVREQLKSQGMFSVEVSIGDTPSCSVLDEFQGVDEIRPGNLVFYDVTQFVVGACAEQDIAAAVACPVVAIHHERREIVMYGGAVHLSKESLTLPDGKTIYGLVALQEDRGWGAIVNTAYVARVSQEHGIVAADDTLIEQMNIGDILMILPVHSCLTVDLLRKYVTLDGEIITTMEK